jgi:MFS family permease
MVFPSTLSLLTNVFTERRERALAIGLWGAVTGGAIALGPIVGGWLLELSVDWRSIFFAMTPIAAIAGVLVAGMSPEGFKTTVLLEDATFTGVNRSFGTFRSRRADRHAQPIRPCVTAALGSGHQPFTLHDLDHVPAVHLQELIVVPFRFVSSAMCPRWPTASTRSMTACRPLVRSAYRAAFNHAREARPMAHPPPTLRGIVGGRRGC